MSQVKSDLKEIGLESLVKHIKVEALFKKDEKNVESVNLEKDLKETKNLYGKDNS